MKNSKLTIGIKQIPIIALLAVFSFISCGQSTQQRPSPPAAFKQNLGKATLTVQYAQPSVKGREIWGSLVPYHKIWRTGANEATTIEFSNTVTIEGHTIGKGKYALFTLPTPDEWTFILNKDWDQWGAYSYNEQNDVLRVKVKPLLNQPLTEELQFDYTNNQLLIKWEKLVLPVSIQSN